MIDLSLYFHEKQYLTVQTFIRKLLLRFYVVLEEVNCVYKDTCNNVLCPYIVYLYPAPRK